jgi:hypothetical protein
MNRLLCAVSIAVVFLVPFLGCESQADRDAKRSARLADEIKIFERMELELARLEKQASDLNRLHKKNTEAYHKLLSDSKEFPNNQLLKIQIKKAESFFGQAEIEGDRLRSAIDSGREQAKSQSNKIARIKEGADS